MTDHITELDELKIFSADDYPFEKKIELLFGFQATLAFTPPYSMDFFYELMRSVQEYYDLTKEHLLSAMMLGSKKISAIANFKRRDESDFFVNRFDRYLEKYTKTYGGQLTSEDIIAWIYLTSAPDDLNAGYYSLIMRFSPGVRLYSVSYVSFSFPLSFIRAQEPGFALKYTRTLCERLKPFHGCAGLAAITPSSIGINFQGSGRYLYPVVRRFIGLDFTSPRFLCFECNKGIKSVNWLTFADDRLLEQAGGRQRFIAVPEPLVSYPYTGGVLIRAGDRPETCDTEAGKSLPAYTAVSDLFETITVTPNFNIFEGVVFKKNERGKITTTPFGSPEELLVASKAWPHRFASK